MELPLFPLHTVLCPGVALPLHVFEDRYKAMVGRCLRASEGFGVVLIREGREVGRSDLALARVGTIAAIREVRRHADGRYDLTVVGTRRFTLDGVETAAQPYLVGEVHELGESVGDAGRARRLARDVSERFIRYVGLLRSDDEDDEHEARGRLAIVSDDMPAGEPAEREDRTADDAGARPMPMPGSLAAPGPAEEGPDSPVDEADASSGPGAPDDELDEAVRRLTMPDDPTTLSYLLGGILQVEPLRRQILLEAGTTEERLEELRDILDREILLLDRRLEAYVPDPRLARDSLN